MHVPLQVVQRERLISLKIFSVDQISSTLSNVLTDAFKGSERTVFWDDQLGANVDPFAKLEGGIFTADWDLKVGNSSKVLYNSP